jgi:hypothetical protein
MMGDLGGKEIKAKLSLCLIKHYAMKAYGGGEWMYRSKYS